MSWNINSPETPETPETTVYVKLDAKAKKLVNPTPYQVVDAIISLASEHGLSVFDVLHQGQPVSQDDIEKLLQENTNLVLEIVKVDTAG